MNATCISMPGIEPTWQRFFSHSQQDTLYQCESLTEPHNPAVLLMILLLILKPLPFKDQQQVNAKDPSSCQPRWHSDKHGKNSNTFFSAFGHWHAQVVQF